VIKKSSNHSIKDEKGTTLVELVILVILLGVGIPAILSIVGQVAIYHNKNSGIQHCMSFATSKMEEIVAYKNINTNWANNISDFAISENLDNGYSRTVTISTINNWGPTGKDASQVDVTVTSPINENGYTLTMIFAQE
jgi:Tfp pilus assembly protein PilE